MMRFFIINLLLCQLYAITGYLYEYEMTDCQDPCSQYYIEPEIDGGFGTIPIIFENPNINIDLYMNRFVTIDLGQEVTCVECSASEVLEINLSQDCEFPVECFVDPCMVEECQINISVDCISNYCGGCHADFYDLDGNLVDCTSTTDECFDFTGLDFGVCAMVLGVGVLNDECNYISGCDWTANGIDYSDLFFDSIEECDEQCSNDTICDEIEENYLELHSEEYTECEYDIDCMSVWGDCDISLGGCHYAVNILNYSEEEINEQVALWLENECMSSVCDCMDLPNVVCNNSNCELAYCSEPNPAGCIQTGCQEGYECVDNVECTPSQCYCDDSYGYWSCTEDCGGGTCVEVYSLGDINNDFQINVLDIVLLVSFILMIDEPTDIEFSAGDINLDENLNILDVVAVVQLILNNNILPEDCYVVPEVGPCDGICPTYYYNQITNQCEEFITGCCGVEAFNTLQECQNTCE